MMLAQSKEIISCGDWVCVWLHFCARSWVESMKTGLWAGATLTIAAVFLPGLVVAQKFQEPTQAELKMTEDPKAPGAPAVFLYREEVTDNFSHDVSCYARIKVLTELGKEWATVDVPYLPGYQGKPLIEGRTIHPDGSVYPLTVSSADLLAAENNAVEIHKLVFNLPNVVVGSILEYRWTRPMVGADLHFAEKLGEGFRKEVLAGLASSELANETPEWEVQQKIFVHKAHFYYNPLNDLERNVIGGQITHWVDGERASYILFTQHLPAKSTVTATPKKDFVLDIQDVPAIQQEADAPPVDSVKYRVRFYWTPYVTASAYWESEQKRWSKHIDEFAVSSDGLKAAAAQITSDAATPEARARKLYDAVQSLENTDFTRTRTEAEREQLHLKRELRNAEEVWSEKSGTSNQIAALYLALARAAGLEAYAVQVADRDSHLFDPNYLSLAQLDSLLVLLRVEGKDVYLDPGEKFCPFGQLRWPHALAGGLSQATKGPTFTPPNESKDAITAHTADLVLSSDGAITGTVKIVMSGPAALRWRQLNLTADTAEVQQQFTESLRSVVPPGANVNVEKFQGLDTSSGYLSATVKISGQLGSATGKHLLVPAFLFSSGPQRHFATEEKREDVVDMRYAEQVIDDVVYHIPSGFTVQSVPPAAQIPWPERAALVVKTQTAASTIEIKHIFARAFVLLDPKEYPALRDYYQKLSASDQQPVVLTSESSSVGN
jgi:hypothetical protein